MIDLAGQIFDPAGATAAAGAQRLDLETLGFEDDEDAFVSGHGESLAGFLQHDVKRLIMMVGREIGGAAFEQFVMHRALRPIGSRSNGGSD